jgi:parvulin-like peptidyl-prolyl isomerase
MDNRTVSLQKLMPAAWCFVLVSFFFLTSSASAKILDRVVAIVDDEAVLLSELQDSYSKAMDLGADITQEEILDALINRLLLLKQAKKFIQVNQSVRDDNILIYEYINKRLKTFIHIPFEEIESFYVQNQESFKGKDFYDVRDEIEKYLVEKETNMILIKHIEELKKKAYIRLQLEKK